MKNSKKMSRVDKLETVALIMRSLAFTVGMVAFSGLGGGGLFVLIFLYGVFETFLLSKNHQIRDMSLSRWRVASSDDIVPGVNVKIVKNGLEAGVFKVVTVTYIGRVWEDGTGEYRSTVPPENVTYLIEVK